MVKRILNIVDLCFELPEGFRGNVGNALVLTGIQRQLAERGNHINTEGNKNTISYQFLESEDDGRTWKPFVPEPLHKEV